MTPILILDDIYLSYGLNPLLDHVKFQLMPSERVCLIGRNGAGKSSLLKIMDGTIHPDSGSVWHAPHTRIATLAQALPQDQTMTVYEFAAQGLAETGQLLAEYHHLTHHLTNSTDLKKLEKIQADIDAKQGWQFEQAINTTLSRLELNPDAPMSSLSGGWQRRAALAQALVCSPDILLLDEPTNHLDISAIEWLENELLSNRTTLVFITHDRSLLQRLATRIVELDRGSLTSWPGDYENFLRRKEETLHAEAKQHADFDKKLAQEEVWIRQGIKARRTRNEGRVRALKAMREMRAQRREQQSKANFEIHSAPTSGARVIEAKHLYHSFDGKPLIQGFSVEIVRGDKIGLVGPNGAGKTTLLNILLGNLNPDKGEIKLGTKLQIAYSDQLRSALDLEKNIVDNVGQGSDFVELNGKRLHIMSYLNQFLFTPARALTPVKALSGGERNRLLLAKLFSQPANLLVLDEPTNDLDLETLELLEEILIDFKGTLLIVSHDRTFLDNVVTSTIYFAGNGQLQEYVGGYKDLLPFINKQQPIVKETITKDASQPQKTKSKLSYKEEKELQTLPDRVEKLETDITRLQIIISEESFYKQSADKINETLAQLKQLEEELTLAYLRWETLETLAQSLKDKF